MSGASSKFNKTYLLLYSVISIFYLFVIATFFRPDVSLEYKLYYMDTKLKHWPKEGGLKYRLGDEIDFTKDVIYLSRDGWSHPEKWGTWTDGKEAGLILTLDRKAQTDLELIVECIGFVRPRYPEQTVSVSVNGNAVDEWEYHYDENHTQSRAFVLLRTVVPLEVIEAEDYMEVNFIVPNAKSPSTLGVSKDKRVLGIGVKKIVIRESRDEVH